MLAVTGSQRRRHLVLALNYPLLSICRRPARALAEMGGMVTCASRWLPRHPATFALKCFLNASCSLAPRHVLPRHRYRPANAFLMPLVARSSPGGGWTLASRTAGHDGSSLRSAGLWATVAFRTATRSFGPSCLRLKKTGRPYRTQTVAAVPRFCSPKFPGSYPVHPACALPGSSLGGSFLQTMGWAIGPSERSASG